MRDAQDPDDRGTSLWRLVKQAFVDLVVAAVVGWLFVVVKNALREPSLATLEQACAIVMVLVGVTFGGRLAIQIRIGYLWWNGDENAGWNQRKRRLLASLTAANVPLTAALIWSGLYFHSNQNGPLQIAVTAVLMVLLAISVNQTMRLIEKGGPPRGSDVVWRCGPVKWLRDSTEHWNRIPGVKALVQAWDDRLPRNHSSKLAILLIFCMGIAVLGEGVAIGLQGADHDDESSLEAKGHAPKSPEPTPPNPAPPAGEATSSNGPPSYTDLCGTEVVPGDGAPEPLSVELRIAWEEPGPAVGCAMRARATAGDAYVIYGHCRGEFWSLAIGFPHHPAAVMLDDAAMVAKQMVEKGELLGASPREDLGAGDFYVFYTTMGPFVLVRKQKTDGEGGPKSKPLRCTELEHAKEKYIVLPPGMAELWMRFNEEVMQIWPSRDTSRTANGFSFQSSDGTTVAQGWCEPSSLTACELVAKPLHLHMTSTSAGAQTVTVQRVLEFGPS